MGIVDPSEAEKLAEHLHSFASKANCNIKYIKLVVGYEFIKHQNEPTALLRAESLGLQLCVKFTRDIGNKYAKEIFSEIMEELLNPDLSLEVDPNKLEEEENEEGEKLTENEVEE